VLLLHLITLSDTHTHTHTHTHLVGLFGTRGQHVSGTRYRGYKGQRAMLSTRFEPAFAAIERPQTYALNSSATGIDYIGNICGITN
jgi:hypothetical protein